MQQTAGAVRVVVQVAAADTVDDGHRLGLRLAVAQHDLAVGRAGRVAQPLELQARVDVGQPAVAVLRNLAASNGFQPVAMMMLPTFNSISSSSWSKSIASVGQSFSQAPHRCRSNQMHDSVSITGTRGTACGNGM